MPSLLVNILLEQQLSGALAGVLDPHGPVAIRTVPGRIDVLGGLAVEAGATVAHMTSPRRIAVAAQAREDGLLVIHSGQIGPPVGDSVVRLAVAELYREGKLIPAGEVGARLGAAGAWAAPLVALWYVLGQTPGMAAARGAGAGGGLLRGLALAVHSDLPMNAGQASSTAVVVAGLEAAAELARVTFEPLDAALVVHRAEDLLAPATGHVVDALTCLRSEPKVGAAPLLLRYSAQPHTLVSEIALPGDLRILAMDTGVRYTASASTVGALRLAGAMGLRIIETIYRDLGQRHTPLHGYLTNVSPSLYRQYFRALLPKRLRGADFLRTYGALPPRAGEVDPNKLYRVRTAVDHLISEHEHAEGFLQTIEDLAATGEEMAVEEKRLTEHRAGRRLLASHHSYRLRLELSCREADWLVDHLMEAGPEAGVLGARITGCGGGGTVVALLRRNSRADDALLDTMNAYHTLTGVPLVVAEAGGAAGR